MGVVAPLAASERLTLECRIYGRYLIGQEPGVYVLNKYMDYHRTSSFGVDAFDRVLLSISTWSPLFTRIADVYASRFRKRAVLRKKLVLLLALLECAVPSSQYIDTAGRGGRSLVWVRMGYRVAVYAATLLAATALLGPVHFCCRFWPVER